MRVGIGYDAHPLVEGRPLVLGGVAIPHTQGLAGHSDSDVLAHAVVDALLGAASLGDIGHLFPPEDPRYKDANSILFIEETERLLKAHRWRVTNVDATIIAQEPRLAPYLPKMRDALSRALGVSADQVNVKGKSTNGLGYEGRGEGIAAHAVVLIESVPS